MKKTFLVASIMLSTALSLPASANTALSSEGIGASSSPNQKMSMIAHHGFDAIRDVQLARLSLFRGNPREAINLTEKASVNLSKDNTEWSQFVKKDKKTPFAEDHYIIIDESVMFNDDFIVTPEKRKAIDKANSQLKTGTRKEALETLKLAGIDISITQYLMPLNQTRKAVAQSLKLLKEDKYYEANLVLKGVADSIITDTVSKDEIF
ncbi:YfdX family protein [Citrobacter braakii]